MGIDLLPEFIRVHYEVHEWKHACAVLATDFPSEWQDIVVVLSEFRLRQSAIAEPGGQRSVVARDFDTAFTSRGWREQGFHTRIVVDERAMESPTHKVDCYKNSIGVELEWNNKDPFYDRDLKDPLSNKFPIDFVSLWADGGRASRA